MPVIPLPPAATPGQQQARSIPEFTVQATGDAFGAGAAEATYRGQMQLVGNIASAAKAESAMYNSAIRGATQIIGQQLQNDWKLEAEAQLHELQINQRKAQEGLTPNGDGASVRKGLEGFDEASQALLANAKVPFQANILKEGIQKLRFAHEREAVGREVAAVKQQRIDRLNTLAEAAQVEVLRDPSKLGEALARTTETINGANLTPHQKSSAIQANSKALYQIALESRVTRNDFGGAQALLKDDAAVMALGPLESLRAQQRVNKAAEGWAEKARAEEHSKRLMAGLEPINPADKEHRKIVDDSFSKTNGPQLLADRNPAAAEYVANVAEKYGVIPKDAIGILGGQAANGSPEQKIFALQTVALVESVRPGAFEISGAHQTLRKEAEYFRHATSGIGGLGLPPEEALARIEEMRTPAFQEKASARKAAIADKRNGPLADVKIEGELVSALDDSRLSDPVVGNPRDRDVIVQTAQKALEDHYIRTGDVGMAKAAAIKDLRRTYGVSRLSGDGTPRIVRNPIEQQYKPINGSHDYIRDQASELIKAETGKDVKPEAIFFQNVRATEEAISRGGFQAGSPPPYGFYWLETTKDGQPEYQTIPGKVFYPDIAQARKGGNSKAQLDRQGRTSKGVVGTMDGFVGERDTSAAETIATAKRAEAVKAPVVPENPADDTKQDLMDLFGFGARAGMGAP